VLSRADRQAEIAERGVFAPHDGNVFQYNECWRCQETSIARAKSFREIADMTDRLNAHPQRQIAALRRFQPFRPATGSPARGR